MYSILPIRLPQACIQINKEMLNGQKKCVFLWTSLFLKEDIHMHKTKDIEKLVMHGAGQDTEQHQLLTVRVPIFMKQTTTNKKVKKTTG